MDGQFEDHKQQAKQNYEALLTEKQELQNKYTELEIEHSQKEAHKESLL